MNEEETYVSISDSRKKWQVYSHRTKVPFDIKARRCEVSRSGDLLFINGAIIVAAYARGSWDRVVEVP